MSVEYEKESPTNSTSLHASPLILIPKCHFEGFSLTPHC